MPKIVNTARNFVRWILSAPDRSTSIYPRLMRLGVVRTNSTQTILKPVPANLRNFGRTPTARRGINTIKNGITQLDWEIRPRKGITMNSEIRRQIRVASNCLSVPNNDDSFATFIEKTIEDYLVVSQGAYEQQMGDDVSGDHPLFMFPIDGSTIKHNALWDGSPDVPRYAQMVGQGANAFSIGEMANLFDNEITLITPNPSNENPFGYGPLEIAMRSISRQLGAAEYAGNVASNAQPLNLLYIGDAGTEGVNSFRAYWRDEIEGQGSTPIVGGKETPKAVKLAGENDAGLYLKWQEFLILEIARAFDLSPQSFGLSREQARSTGGKDASVSDNRDINHAVVPLAMKIKDVINRKTILGRMGFTSVEFDWPSLRQEDRLKQAEIDELRYQNNQITPNEAREARGEEPLDNPYADVLYADVQIAIGEARRGNAAAEGQPGSLRNTPSRVRAQNRNT